VTLFQRFDSTLNLNIHFHILFLDGVYLTRRDQADTGRQIFRSVKASGKAEREALLHRIYTRLSRFLVQAGGAGAEQGEQLPKSGPPGRAPAATGLRAQYHLLHRGRPPARFAALVPKPRVNLTRFHGMFAPNSQYRKTLTSAKGGCGVKEEIRQRTDAGAPIGTARMHELGAPAQARLPYQHHLMREMSGAGTGNSANSGSLNEATVTIARRNRSITPDFSDSDNRWGNRTNPNTLFILPMLWKDFINSRLLSLTKKYLSSGEKVSPLGW